MSAQTRRVAVIGCGDVSRVHFAAIAALPDAELVAVCDSDAARLAAAAAEHGVAAFDDHRMLLRDARPDVVHICTPHDLHASIAVDALEAGVNVVLEKPLAHTREEGARLVETAERGAAKIAVCFQNRYNVPVQAAHAMVRSGQLGAVRAASATVKWHRTAEYYRDRPWRGRWSTGGGGLLMNQAIHTLDLLQWILGDVVHVAGGVATRHLAEYIEVEDTADLVLHHENGGRSVFYATLANALDEPVTIDITMERATLHLRGNLTVTHEDGRVETVRDREASVDGRSYWGTSHELLIRDFYERLDHPEPFWISPSEAKKTLDIIQSVYDQSYPERISMPADARLSA